MRLPNVTLQWHLTTQCEFSCNYCYLKDRKFKSEICYRKVISEILTLNDRYRKVKVNLTGGNPLLHKSVVEIVNTLTGNNVSVNILGNPINANQVSIIEELKNKIGYYQLSLDGLKYGNISNRNNGDINSIWESVEILNKFGVSSNIMLTLTNQSVDELTDVIKACQEHNVSSFYFARVVQQCEGNTQLQPAKQEYPGVLEGILDFIVKEDYPNFYFKDSLWKLLLYERDAYVPKGISGCGVGRSVLSIMPDGSVQPCSRIPLVIDNIEESRLIEIIDNNVVLEKFRDFNNFEECAGCELLNVCRGCPAVTYARTGNCFKRDPHCWK